MPNDSNQFEENRQSQLDVNNPTGHISVSANVVKDSAIVIGNNNIVIMIAGEKVKISPEQQQGFWDKLANSVYQRAAQLDVLGRRCVSIEDLYQSLPLLQELKKEELPSKDINEKEASQALSQMDLTRWEEDLRQHAAKYNSIELVDIFREYRMVVTNAVTDIPRLILLGPPGSGKSTLLQYLSFLSVKKQSPFDQKEKVYLPIQLSLRQWERMFMASPKDADSLPDYLNQKFGNLAEFPTVPLWINWLRDGKVLLLLDGLDETNGDLGFREQMKNELSAYPNCPVMITCRTVSYDRFETHFSDFAIFTLAGLQIQQRNAYITRYPAENIEDYLPSHLIEQLERSPQLETLATNPLLLSILCFVMDGTQKGAPLTRRGDLYAATIRKLLVNPKRDEVSYGSAAPTLETKYAILAQVSLSLFLQHGNERRLVFTEKELHQEIRKASRAEGYRSAEFADALRKDLVERCGILRGTAEDGYWFLHLTLHEYLVADALANQINSGGWDAKLRVRGRSYTIRYILDKKVWLPAWQEVIVFLVGQLDEPCTLLEMLSDLEKDDRFLHRTGVAALCLPEIPHQQLETYPLVFDRISKRIFRPFWELGNLSWDKFEHLIPALGAIAKVNSKVIKDTRFFDWIFESIAYRKQEREGYDDCQFLKIIEIIGKNAYSPEVINGLIEMLSIRDGTMRHFVLSAIKALGHIDSIPVEKELFAYLEDYPNKNIKIIGSQLLVEPDGNIADYEDGELLANQLIDQEYNVRRHAWKTIQALGPAVVTPKFLKRLAKLIAHPNKQVRENLLNTLLLIGEYIARDDFFDYLADQLAKSEWSVAQDIFQVFLITGQAAAANPKIITQMVSLLHSPEDAVRLQAIEALASFGQSAAKPEILICLPGLLTDANDQVKISAANLISSLGPLANQPDLLTRLVLLLSDPNHEVGGAATGAILQLGPEISCNPETISQLSNIFYGKQENSHLAAFLLIELLGESVATPDFLDGLMSMLADSDQEVRSIALYAIDRIKKLTLTDSLLVRLTDLFYDPNEDIRSVAVFLISEKIDHNMDVSGFYSRLGNLLTDQKVFVRETAVFAVMHLGEIVATQEEIVEHTIDLLTDETPVIRKYAAQALEAMGRSIAKPRCIETLITLLDDPERSVRWAASYALEVLDLVSPELIKSLPASLSSPKEELRWYALGSVLTLGEKAAKPDIVGCVAELFNDPEWSIRVRAVNAIGALGKGVVTPDIFLRLVRLANDPDEHVQESVFRIIKNLKTLLSSDPLFCDDYLSVLENLLSDSDLSVCVSALRIIQILEPAKTTPLILSNLEKLLNHADYEISIAASRAIKAIGRSACTAPILHSLANILINSNYTYVRDAALETISAMGTNAIETEFITCLMKSWNKKEYSEALKNLMSAGVRIFQTNKSEYFAKDIRELGAL